MIKITKKSVKTYFSIAWRELAVIGAALFIDLLSKYLISHSMEDGQKVALIPNFLSFLFTVNYQATMGFDFFNFFGQGDKMTENGKRIFFIVFMSVAVTGFFVFLVFGHKNRFFYRLPLALIVGGALGNLYDRIFVGGVRDFIHVEYFGKNIGGHTYFPTFNLADSSLVIGVGLFIVYLLFFYFKDEKKKEEAKKLAEAGAIVTSDQCPAASEELRVKVDLDEAAEGAEVVNKPMDVEKQADKETIT
ncbi:MAG: signal peptidase II [Firmicutes bacterium]|nr:signal peptidase II [Bacillota bacterium]